MDNPDLFDEHSGKQSKHESELIHYLISKMDCKACEHVMDFGCGSGGVTKKILLPALEENYTEFGRIHAIDISEDMIDFASTKYCDPKITYLSVDILKEEYQLGSFDKIFSFYVLHWLTDQRKAFERFHSIMKPGGEIGFYFASSGSHFRIYETMSKDSLWAPFHYDVEKIIPKAFYSLDPAMDVRSMMESVGFIVHESKVLTRTVNYSSVENVLEFYMSLNPFIGRIPQEMHKSYRDTFLQLLRPFCQSAPTSKSPFAVNLEHQVVLVVGQKP